MDIRALAAAAAAFMFTTAAQADGPPPGAPPPPVAVLCCEPPALWTGVYLGTHVGAAWSDPTWSFPFVESFTTFPGEGFSQSASAPVWGGHVGINYQFHRVLLIGAEVGYANSWVRAITRGPFASSPFDRFKISEDDLLTVAGRFGYVFHDQYLLYGKAGYANSQIELSAASPTAGVAAHVTQREDGWLVGTGLESRIISNILFGLEYNYIEFSGDRFATATNGTPFHADIGNLHTQTFVARLGILFGPQACCSEGVLGKY